MVMVCLYVFALLTTQTDDLSGNWEIQSLGAFRDVVIRHTGNNVFAYRVMWPEFRGKPYKLEHLYRGTISGNDIHGKLFVKEVGLSKFDPLRDFQASIEPNGELIWDGLPCKRVDKPSDPSLKLPKEMEEPKPTKKKRANEAPSLLFVPTLEKNRRLA